MFNDFSKVKILVIGDIMLDQYWWGRVSRISPEAPVPVVKLERTSLALGGAANVAANVAGLGATPLLVGIVGTDAEADLLVGTLSGLGVSPEHLVRLDKRPTTVKTRIIAHSQQVVRVDSEIANEIDENEEAAVWGVIERLISDVDLVIVSDYAKGVVTDRLLQRLFDAAHRSGKMVFVDPKGKQYSKYSGAALLTPNLKEAADAAAVDEGRGDLVEHAGERLLNELGLEMLLITQGEGGMTLFRRDAAPEHLPAVAKEIYDVTGAGDTVIACLGVAMAAGYGFVEAARIANAAAGLVVEQVGTTFITAERLSAVIAPEREAAR
jgi:rfaE bifunctional protein kinase chain/domain